MNGVRFYLEFPDHTTKKKSGRAHVGHSGNVVAVFLGDEHRSHDWKSQEALGAVYDHPNSGVACTMTALDYTRAKCKRIPERLARVIHPRLFDRLDEDDDTVCPDCKYRHSPGVSCEDDAASDGR